MARAVSPSRVPLFLESKVHMPANASRRVKIAIADYRDRNLDSVDRH